MRLITILTALVLVACSKSIELKDKSGILFLNDVEVGIADLKNVPWSVGKEREVEISKGIQFDVEVPKIDSDASNILWQKHGIDSFIYRITKINRGSRQHIGYVAIDSKSAKHITESFTVHIFYHAASVSRDFRRFHCPAFEHRKILVETSLEPSGYKTARDIYARATEHVRGEVSRLSFSPLIFSGGAKLEGKYLTEIALFNSKEKRLYSNWTPLKNIISVDVEGIKKVQSCLGVREELDPLPSSRAPRIEDLQLR